MLTEAAPVQTSTSGPLASYSVNLFVCAHVLTVQHSVSLNVFCHWLKATDQPYHKPPLVRD